MTVVSVKADFKDAERKLASWERKQLPYAAALAIKNAAWFTARTVLPATMPQVFDRPTTFTKRAFYASPKRPDKVNLSARVHIKDGTSSQPGRGGKIGTPAFYYLQPQIYGGQRRAKRHEIALRRMGILGQNEYTVPGQGMRLNRFGNLPGAMYSKILADVNQASRAGGDDISQGFGQRTTRRGGKRFFYDPNLRPRGIWQRQSRKKVVPALVFVKAPRYAPRFDFHGIAKRAALKRFKIEFPRALQRALDTAR